MLDIKRMLVYLSVHWHIIYFDCFTALRTGWVNWVHAMSKIKCCIIAPIVLQSDREVLFIRRISLRQLRMTDRTQNMTYHFLTITPQLFNFLFFTLPPIKHRPYTRPSAIYTGFSMIFNHHEYKSTILTTNNQSCVALLYVNTCFIFPFQ